MDLFDRKPLRMAGHDYSNAGYYYVTICTRDREHYLGEIVVPTSSSSVGGGVPDAPFLRFSDMGKVVDNRIIAMDEQYPHVSIAKYVVMPDHVHLLISVRRINRDGSSRTPTPTNAVIPAFVSTFKRFTNKEIGLGFSIWQRSYYDHIIRDEDDYVTRWRYIDENPKEWAKNNKPVE